MLLHRQHLCLCTLQYALEQIKQALLSVLLVQEEFEHAFGQIEWNLDSEDAHDQVDRYRLTNSEHQGWVDHLTYCGEFLLKDLSHLLLRVMGPAHAVHVKLAPVQLKHNLMEHPEHVFFVIYIVEH